MADVYRFTLPDGQAHAWHGEIGDLRKAHPEASITGKLVLDDLKQGTWEPYSSKQAAADSRKATKDQPKAEVPAPEREAKPAKRDGK